MCSCLNYLIFFNHSEFSSLYLLSLKKQQTNLNAENRVKNRSQTMQICRIKGYLRETHKLQNINSICPTPKFTFGII